MTITLDDVRQISGLPIDGPLLEDVQFENLESAVDLVHLTLGVDKSDILVEFKKNLEKPHLSMKWIKAQMSGKMILQNPDSGNEASDEEEEAPNRALDRVDCAVRGYILYAFGCNLFATKSGTLVHVGYLKYLTDLDNVRNIAFGASGLGFLYKCLGDASKQGTSQICGFLPLLEVWLRRFI